MAAKRKREDPFASQDEFDDCFRLIDKNVMEVWGYHSLAEWNAAVRRGEVPGPEVVGYTTTKRYRRKD
jgi:hypothetical protein